MIGKLIQTTYLLLADEDMRDAREAVNKSQHGYPKDWGWDEQRIDRIGANGATGEHYAVDN